MIEGILICTNPQCRSEYPIIDGIPIIVADVRAYVSQQLLSIMGRQDLAPPMESLISDCCGQGSDYEGQRRNLSIYGFDHYGDFDPDAPEGNNVRPGSVARLLRRAMGALDVKPTGPVIDFGCSVGRTSFELADALDVPVLGVDLNFSMLKAAMSALADGHVDIPLKRVGIVYDRKRFPVRFNRTEKVDFWACDATNLPFADAGFGFGVSLNLLDCVTSPYEHLCEVDRVLQTNARAAISSPYDWNVAATPAEAWIGGHSQRSEHAGSSEILLRSLFSSDQHPGALKGLEIVSEIDHGQWHLYLHDRSTMTYQVHLFLLRKK